MAVEIISWSISRKVWDRAGIELATPESAVRLTSVGRHVTDCAAQHGYKTMVLMTKGSLMKDESIAEWAFCNTFDFL